jgi:hypothetical protein
MREDAHTRAARLIDIEQVEGLAPADREWLGKHLGECDCCAARLRATERAIRALRSVTVPATPTLVSTAQRRVRLRALQLREERGRLRALWISCALSWVMGAVTAPWLWQGLEWLGRHIALPQAVRVPLFLLIWIVPAVVVGAVMAWQRARALSENGYPESAPR